MIRSTRIAVAFLLLGLAACGGDSVVDPTGDDRADTQRALSSARASWRSQGIASYTWAVRRNCFCTPDTRAEARVVVRGGAIVSAERTDGGGAADAGSRLTVEDLFAIVQQAIDERAYQVDVTYDARLGYPTRVWIDRSPLMADEEQGWDTRDLVRN